MNRGPLLKPKNGYDRLLLLNPFLYNEIYGNVKAIQSSSLPNCASILFTESLLSESDGTRKSGLHRRGTNSNTLATLLPTVALWFTMQWQRILIPSSQWKPTGSFPPVPSPYPKTKND